MGGLFKPKQTTQQTSSTFKPSAQQTALTNPAVQAGQQYAASPPKLPDYSQVSGFTPAQLQAHQMLLGAAGQQQNFVNQAGAANEFLLGDVLDPSSNRFLDATIQSAIRPLNQQFLETILPGISDEAITAGQFGGSRGEISKGIASRGLSDASSDAAVRIASQGYGQGLDALVRGLALTPQTLASFAQPGLTTAAVGGEQQGMNQRLLDEQAYRHMYQQMAPWLAAKEVAGVGAALPGGTNVATAPGPSQPSPFQTMLGLAAGAAPFMLGQPQLSPMAMNLVTGGQRGLM